MFFREIELTDFRNYETEKVSFHEKVNVMTGNNAQGKTNLLESLYLMSVGKSFRSVHDSDMIRFGAGMARVKALVDSEGDNHDIEVGIIKSGKSIKIDGVNRKKTSDLFGLIYVVMFSPEDLRIIKDDPSHRRRFIDRELCRMKPVYYSDLAAYNRILKQRNAFLKDEKFKESILDVWDEELSVYGSRIIQERKKFINTLSGISGYIHGGLTEEGENLTLKYETDIEAAEDKKDQQEIFFRAVRESRRNDIFRRTTGRGPHHDDICIEINGFPVRKYGSQGQQRSAALSLKLAEIEMIKRETGESPVVLLDDVLSELDDSRQKQLINLFSDAQIFITSTELEKRLASGIGEHALFRVNSGNVERLY